MTLKGLVAVEQINLPRSFMKGLETQMVMGPSEKRLEESWLEFDERRLAIVDLEKG